MEVEEIEVQRTSNGSVTVARVVWWQR